jgi:vacuolar-type H+-ATPase catalytic subunit A/Vma1
LVAVANANSFSNLEATTQAIITSILRQSSDFDAAFIAQTADIKELHDEDRNLSESQHNTIINTIKDTSQISQSHNTEEHEKTREEVSQLKDEAAKLKSDMEKEFAELKALIKATGEAKSDKQQKALKEKATAASASWLAKDIIYSNLMVGVPRS